MAGYLVFENNMLETLSRTQNVVTYFLLVHDSTKPVHVHIYYEAYSPYNCRYHCISVFTWPNRVIFKTLVVRHELLQLISYVLDPYHVAKVLKSVSPHFCVLKCVSFTEEAAFTRDSLANLDQGKWDVWS